jgi:O-antigen ligase
MLIGFLILASWCLFPGPDRRLRAAVGFGAAVIGVAVVLNQTRSIWLALLVSLAILVALWRPWFLLAIPVLTAGAYLAAPPPLQERMLSIVQPHGERDSNSHRVVCFRTGWEMVKANPVFGLGPEGPKREFMNYLPADIQQLPEGYYAHLHNVFLQYAAERGIPGLLLLLAFLALLAREWLAAWRTATEPARRILAIALSGMAGTLVSGLFEYNLGNSEVLHLFLVICACGWIAARPERYSAA